MQVPNPINAEFYFCAYYTEVLEILTTFWIVEISFMYTYSKKNNLIDNI